MTVFQLIGSDYKKYRKYGSNFFVILFLTQGFWATFQYRFAHYFHAKVKWQPFRFIIMMIFYFWQKLIEILTGISIPAAVTIGKSFYIAHYGHIIINSDAVIGDNCNISQGVTIGVSGLFPKQPIITSSFTFGIK